MTGLPKVCKRKDRGHKILSSALLLLVFLFGGCGSPDLSDDPIPVVPFAPLTINLFLPEYQSLRLDGGTKEIGSIGVRGVILYRASSTSYLAYEKNCSYHPNAANSYVDVHASKLFMVCSGCGSNFSFTDGTSTGGVAWRPLRRYRVELNNPILTITDEIAF
ncbi:hypothetical protein BH09BAC3_BH09BAC3_21870 [soil metagenome]